MKSFHVNDNKGFSITFPSGITLSTQFGFGNYCENNMKKELMDVHLGQIISSQNCEIAIMDIKDDFITQKMLTDLEIDAHYDDVLGYVDIDLWLKIVEWCKNYK